MIAPLVRDTAILKDYVAEIHSVQFVEVRSHIGGYIEKIHADEGQLVNAGQPLFDVSSAERGLELQRANAALRVVQAELNAAEVELRNTGSLVDQNISSQAELDLTRARVDALHARVEEAASTRDQAALNLSYSHIKAPYRGKINRIPFKTGSIVQEADVLTTITDNSEMFAYFHLSELDYLQLRGTLRDSTLRRVTLLLPNGVPYQHQGRIEVAESEFDRATGNIAIRARFPNAEGVLKHGANANIELRRPLEDAVMVPQRSTFEVQDKLYVLVVRPDSTVEQRNISASFRLPDLYVVESGLEPDERIVFEGVQRLRHDDRIVPAVTTTEAAMKKIGNH
ncbi:MAG: efflux RND transporter periplasmic adaptor subunit [Flavobacteriales bacterium]|nr:efflux RND transporter periplasmic adaptor subunit [Flavobacteriales bacterium]